MKTRRRVLAFTGIRSDYDLLSELYKMLHTSRDFDFGLVVSGAHLSSRYGHSILQIQKDRLPIIARLRTLPTTDIPGARLEAGARLILGALPAIRKFKPDLLLFAGDREDAVVASLLGTYLGIPMAHFFGGDHADDGHIDNPVRHATSKLASIHFVAHQEHAKRLQALGEMKSRIFHVGSPAIDKLLRVRTLSRSVLLKRFKKEAWTRYALVIFHPVPQSFAMSAREFEEILMALKKEKLPAFVGYPNIDAGNLGIINVIKRYAHDPHFVFYKNLDRDIFTSLMKNAATMVGNSSAGLYEAPSFKLGVVNVGSRQRGRMSSNHIVFVDNGMNNIRRGIRRVLSKPFQKKLKKIKSPFGDGRAAQRTFRILRRLDYKKFLLKKEDALKV